MPASFFSLPLSSFSHLLQPHPTFLYLVLRPFLPLYLLPYFHIHPYYRHSCFSLPPFHQLLSHSTVHHPHSHPSSFFITFLLLPTSHICLLPFLHSYFPRLPPFPLPIRASSCHCGRVVWEDKHGCPDASTPTVLPRCLPFVLASSLVSLPFDERVWNVV